MVAHLVFPFIKRIPTEKDVDSIIISVTRKSQDLKQSITNVTDAAILDTHKQISAFPEKLDKGVQRILEEMKLQRQSTAENHYRALAEQFGIDAQTAVRPLLGGLLEEFERGLEFLSYKIQENQFLTAMELYRSLTPLPLADRVGMTAEQLLDVLRIDPLGMTSDLQTVLQSREQVDHGTPPQTVSLLHNNRFKRWCSSIDPSLLLVDASLLDGMLTSKISALSSACASVVASIVKAQPNAIPLFFFCGLHTTPQDHLQGPRGLIRTLIASLLVELDGRKLASLDFINTHEYREALEAHDVSSLCYAFRDVVRQWPVNTVVYCVIDGIGWCDRAGWSEDFDLILTLLCELVGDRRLRPIFKVLISSPVRSQTVSNAIRREHTIFLGAEPSPAREEFPPERYILLDQEKAEYLQMEQSEDVKDDDYYT